MCLYPRLGYLSTYFDENGMMKQKMNFLPRDYEASDLDLELSKTGKYLKVPCKNCIECRLAYARDWATRMWCEAQRYPIEEVNILALTYDDDHVPVRTSLGQTGVVSELLTVVPRDLRMFLDHVRRSYPDSKYFACSEYGDETARPHFHVVLFGVPFEDMEFYGMSNSDIPMFISATAQKYWSEIKSVPVIGRRGQTLVRRRRVYDTLGRVWIEPWNWRGAAYVARYLTKKQMMSANSLFDKGFLEPPKTYMSDNLGLEWFAEHMYEFMGTFSIPVLCGDKVKRMPIPEAFLEYAAYMGVDISKARNFRASMVSDRAKLDMTDLSYSDFLFERAERLEQKNKFYKRT